MSDTTSQLDLLIADQLDGELTALQHAELEGLLRDDPAARGDYARLVAMHAMLDSELNGQLPPLALGTELETVDGLADEARVTPLPRRVWETVRDAVNNNLAVSLLVSGLFMTVFLLSLALWTVPEWRPAASVAQQPSTEFVARITNIMRAEFDATSGGNLKNRDLFDDDKIVLNSGLVVIEYDTGTRVVLEGPATYHVDGPNGGDLRRGRLVARIDTDEAKGFSVETPTALVEDFGTEFGIEVHESGTSDVVVLSGEVEVVPNGSLGLMAERVRLVKGQRAVVAPGGEITRPSEVDVRVFAAMRSRLNANSESVALDDGEAGTINEIESATGGVYLDFEFNTGPGANQDGVFARGGLTATTSGSGWQFPDSSLAAGGGSDINATGMDDNRGNTPEFSTVVSGLNPSTEYQVFVLTLGHSDPGQNWGIAAGTISGELTVYEDVANDRASIDVTRNGVVSLYARSIGPLTSTAEGTLTIFFDNDPGLRRTLYDGISLVELTDESPKPESPFPHSKTEDR